MKHIRYILAMLALVSTPLIQAAEPASSALHELQKPETAITVRHGGVEIANPTDDAADVSVYAITGQQVKHCSVPPGTSHIELPAGCYIVRVDGLSRRVAIR